VLLIFNTEFSYKWYRKYQNN